MGAHGTKPHGREACAHAGPTDGRAPLGRLPSKGIVALQTEAAPRYTCRDAIIYELHVKGRTLERPQLHRARTPGL
jgi:pullulanase/glycogen debranching enzyme